MKLKLFADHHQVHLLDDRDGVDLSEAWTAQATEDRLAASDGALAIGTRDADHVSVEVKVLAKEPPDDAAKWQHVTAGSVAVSSGRLVAMGCTDYLPEAKRLKLEAGTYRARVSHRGLDKGIEQVRVELWPGAARQPAVLKRWAPPPAKPPKPVKAPKTAKAAAALARQGEPDAALEVLLKLSEAGDGAAAASAAVLLAYRGRWAEVVPRAMALLRNPKAVYAGNVFDDMGGLVNRCAVELKDPSIVTRAAAVVPPEMASRTQAVILENVTATLHARREENRAAFEKAVAEATGGKRFAGKPEQLAQHCFGLAMLLRVDDELIARYQPASPMVTFDHVEHVARAHVRRGDPEEAWSTLEAQLGRWTPMDFSQVAPVALLVDVLLAPLMTHERCERVLKTPRGPEKRA